MGWGTGNIGNGSGGLNFKIVGGTSEPSNPRENTIWVNTDQKITSWIFSATEPKSPSEGLVWFKTGTYSPVAFNALKKNGVPVYPVNAKQYISGAWTAKTAKSYQYGTWNNWFLVLYDEGYENVKFYNSSVGGTATFTDSYILLSAPSNKTGSVKTGLIDITQCSSVIVSYKNKTNFGSISEVAIIVLDSGGNRITRVNDASPVSSNIVSLDVSNLSGEYEIKTQLYSDGATNTAQITELKLKFD